MLFCVACGLSDRREYEDLDEIACPPIRHLPQMCIILKNIFYTLFNDYDITIMSIEAIMCSESRTIIHVISELHGEISFFVLTTKLTTN